MRRSCPSTRIRSSPSIPFCFAFADLPRNSSNGSVNADYSMMMKTRSCLSVGRQVGSYLALGGLHHPFPYYNSVDPSQFAGNCATCYSLISSQFHFVISFGAAQSLLGIGPFPQTVSATAISAARVMLNSTVGLVDD